LLRRRTAITLFLFEVDGNNQVVAQSVHKSGLRTVNYQAVASGDKTFVVGTGAEGRNWRASYMGQGDLSGLSLVVLDNEGKPLFSQTWKEKEFEKRFEVAGSDDPNELQRFTGGPQFLPGGDAGEWQPLPAWAIQRCLSWHPANARV
jgi:hypothetical protein